MQLIPGEVLKHSIITRTNREVEFFDSWSPKQGWHPLLKKYPKGKYKVRGTEFSTWRWLIPELLNWEGKAIYLDADQLVFADIEGLWNSVPLGLSFSAVVGAIGEFNQKPLTPDAVETSVMAMNLNECPWDIIKDLFEKVRDRTMLGFCRTVKGHQRKDARSDYGAMMQACWMDKSRIKPLEKSWNYFNDYVPGRTKLLHFSHVASQPYKKPQHKNSKIFRDELNAAVASGFIDRKILLSEISKGHIHGSYSR